MLEDSAYSPQQLALLNALADRSPDFARMYRGSLQVLHSDNADKKALAAHDLREMIDKLAQHFDVPVKIDLKIFVELNNACRAWEEGKKKTSCTRNGKWSGLIDCHLRKCLRSLDKFFSRFRDSKPRKPFRIANLLKKLDPAGQRLPNDLLTQKTKTLTDLDDYFVGVAHHGQDDDFEAHLEQFEFFLLEHLKQHGAVADLDTIDAIVAEGEGND